ncbi:MAG: hypothetical protein QOI16_3588, partial [Pseudonocardiales bacterium]|nr:hypothetical protein [Pseudonocardiales bacterium]
GGRPRRASKVGTCAQQPGDYGPFGPSAFSAAATFVSGTFSSLTSALTRFTPAPFDLAFSSAAVSAVVETPSALASV